MTTMATESEERNEADPPPPPPPAAAATMKAEKAAASGGAVLITVRDEDGEGNGKGPRADVARGEEEEAEEFEKVCRICQLSSDRAAAEGAELILIGCGCKNELGTAHRHCAETWFRLKRNRGGLSPQRECAVSCFWNNLAGYFKMMIFQLSHIHGHQFQLMFCEICGLNAKNITGDEDDSFMVEWNDNRPPSSGGHRNSSEGVRCWRGQPFCNFLMACLVVAFILPWFFRVNMF